MTSSRFKDKSGFRLQFEKKCDAQLKEFFMSQYELVDDVAKEKLHCSSCDIHIGTAPSAEKQIRTHTVLGVTQCLKCYTFYVSWKFFFCLLAFIEIYFFDRIRASSRSRTEARFIADGAVKAVPSWDALLAHTSSAAHASVPTSPRPF